MARLESVRKPVIAQIEGFAVGGGFRIATACDLRIATPDARFGAPIARTLGNCLSMAAYASFVDVFGPSRLKELIFTAGCSLPRRRTRRATCTRSCPRIRSRRG